jgi:transcriptional regulator with XRE-family HTH domain
MNRLSDLRNRLAINQLEMGASIGLSQGGCSNYENGRELRGDLIRLICQKYQVSSDWLLGVQQGDRDMETLRNCYYTLNEGGRARLFEYAVMPAGHPKYTAPNEHNPLSHTSGVA